ncbi:MAG: copper chaperone [Chlorobi bacterium CHB2]|nr:copper chaperone [Chlorobi bacterium CHB2]
MDTTETNTTLSATETLTIAGMSCGHCVVAVRQALQELEGVQVQNVTIGSAQIRRDPARATNQQLTEAIEDAGYTIGGIH